MKRTIIVNLYGGPGTGKSTTAASTFAHLKQNGVNCELAHEYAKEIVWEGRNYLFEDQLYVFAKQNRRLERLYGKVDVVITDCPLLLSFFYSGCSDSVLLELIEERRRKAIQVDIFLKRVKKFNPIGRLQNEQEAVKMDGEMKEMLDRHVQNHITFTANNAAGSIIANYIMRMLG